MQKQQLQQFRRWFDDYVAGFYGNDLKVNANLKLKEDHSRRTCQEMLYLAEELKLSENQKQIAETIAMFHDIGRFEQFIRYGTYNDARSTDHSLLGVDVLGRYRVLKPLTAQQQDLILKAIEYHGLMQLPGNLKGQSLTFAKLIRDADKLDVFYVVTEYYKQYRANPEEFILEIEFPDIENYSAEMIDCVLNGQRIDYSRLQTLNDMKLLQLGWVFDVNFTATLKRIKQRKFLEKLISFLPQTTDIERVRKRIFGFVDRQIQSGGP